MIKTSEFTDKQKEAIAEYIFADMTGTIIKSEAEAVIQVFQQHHIAESFVSNLSYEDVSTLILDNTTNETRMEVYNLYTSGKL